MTNFYRAAGLALAILNLTLTTNPVGERKITGSTETLTLSPAQIHELATKPFAKNWGLNKFIGVNAYEAWKTTQGNSNIVVAVVDTGIDLNHSSLKNNIWSNPGETGLDKLGNNKSTNGVDDDKDGFIDNVHGWDFVQEKDITTDYHGHGTHVAGIIASAADIKNGRGGVAPKVKVSAYSYYISEGNVDKNSIGKKMIDQGMPKYEVVQSKSISKLNADNTTKALRQAIKDGAKIINYSGGGPSPDDEEKAVLELARDKGIIVVVAAGNEQEDLDQPGTGYFPCNYQLSNIICVGNIDSNGLIPSSSNKGIKFVHVFAPGQDIYSTMPGSSFGRLTGTSQATAFVSGVAALILSQDPKLKPEQVKNLIMNTVDKVDSLKYESLSQGKVNAAAALAGLQNPLNFQFDEYKIKQSLLAEKRNQNKRNLSADSWIRIKQITNNN